MEKLIAAAKSAFLLEAPLEVLHEESMEWLEEIEFWKDEAAFFYSLILKSAQSLPLSKSKEAKEIESQLVYLSSERLDDLMLEVKVHEKFLANMIGNVRLDEQGYRSRHKEIVSKLTGLENEFRSLKREIFALIKQ
jgi:hypothetical protein